MHYQEWPEDIATQNSQKAIVIIFTKKFIFINNLNVKDLISFAFYILNIF